MREGERRRPRRNSAYYLQRRAATIQADLEESLEQRRRGTGKEEQLKSVKLSILDLCIDERKELLAEL